MKEKDNKNVEKYLRLTPKGVACAALLGVTLEKLKTYEQQGRPLFSMQLLLEVIRDADKKDLLMHRAAEYILKNKFFDSNDSETRNRINLLAFLLADSAIRVDQNLTLVELVKRFGLDTEFVRKALVNKKRNIELLLDELSLTRIRHKGTVEQQTANNKIVHEYLVMSKRAELSTESSLDRTTATDIMHDDELKQVFEPALKPSPPEFSIPIDEDLKAEIDRLWKTKNNAGLRRLKLHIKEGKFDNLSVDLTSTAAQKSHSNLIPNSKIVNR